jgi:threonine dehydratase
LRERVDRILLVTEEEIIQSMRLITEHLRSTVEPSGAVAASPALHRQIEGDELRIGIILSGGNLDADALAKQ